MSTKRRRGMGRLVLRRLLSSIPLLLIVSMIVFVLESLIPGDVARGVAGVNATAAQIAMLNREAGLDQPLWVQYMHWLGNALHGSLGSSLVDHSSVAGALASRLPVTLSLVIGATLVATVAGMVLGVLSSRGNRLVARVVDVLSIGGLAVPSFWLALILISLFAVKLRLLPATGYIRFGDSPSGWAQSLVLPVVALSMNGVTAIAKLTREAMLDVLDSEFVRNLRANGIPERSVVYRHALRSSAMRITTMSALLFIGALGGSVVIENVFGIPGLGSLAVAATTAKDYPVIQGVAIYFTLLVIAVNLLTDVTYGWINPRVRTQ
jgi:peptide/nickel transport system permease protein